MPLYLVYQVVSLCAVALVGAKQHPDFLSKKFFLFLSLSSLLRVSGLFFYTTFDVWHLGLDLGLLILTAIATSRLFLANQSDEKDVFPGWAVLTPSTVLVIVVHYGKSASDLVFVAGIFLEAFAVLPLLVMVETKCASESVEVPAFVRLLVASICVHGVVSLVFLPWFTLRNFGSLMVAAFLQSVFCVLWYIWPSLFDSENNKRAAANSEQIV